MGMENDIRAAELAVVQAAMAWHYALLANLYPEAIQHEHATTLAKATYALAVTCPECNAGGHTCPGDGNSIAHGANNCGEHGADPHQDAVEDAAEAGWVPRTWADVRAGDRVRMPGTNVTADIFSAVHIRHHTDPRSSEYHPRPLDWDSVHVRFTVTPNSGGTLRMMNPAAPVEIELSPAEVQAIELLGWENRLKLVEETS